MTQQVPDEIFDGDEPCRLNAILPLPWFVVVPVPVPVAADVDDDDVRVLHSTACWRRYVARWQLRDGRLWLTSVRGTWRLPRKDEPVHARWFTGVLRLLGEHYEAGEDDASVDADDDWRVVRKVRRWRWDPWRSRRCRELDVRAGCVVRERSVDVGCDHESPIWQLLPGGDRLFSEKRGGYPLSDRPSADAFHHHRLRRACWQARTARSLTPGEAAVALGMARRKAGRITEWEAGVRDQPSDWVERYCAVLGIDAATVADMARADAADARAADEAWLSTPVRPVLSFTNEAEDQGRSYRYEAPESVPTGDDAAALAWARECIALTWRPAQLVASRRVVCSLDADGQQVVEGTGDDAQRALPK
jgi:hypothetical protein